MTVWKMVSIPSQVDEKMEKLRQVLGYKAKWRVIQEALDLLEQRLEDKQGLFVNRALQILVDLGVRETRNTRPLLAIIYQILSSPHLSEDEKDQIIVGMIEVARKMRDIEAERIAKQEVEDLFNKIRGSGGQ